MKKILLFIFLFSIKSFSQNLVPNPSFEDTIPCSLWSGPPQLPATSWFWANLGSSDYYSSNYNCGWGSVPSNANGYQFAQTGIAYCGFFVWYGPPQNNLREYVQVELDTPLVSGKKYYLNFFISLAEVSQYASDGIGAYFSNNFISGSNGYNLPFAPQINNTSGNIINDSINWVNIGGNYIANGGEKHITIGNFKNDTNTNISLATGNYPISYYYIDGVSLVDSGWAGITENSFSNFISISPNPATNQITIDSKQYTKGEIEIFDVMGKLIQKSKVKSQKKEIDISFLEKGVYYLRISSEGKSAVKKFVKM